MSGLACVSEEAYAIAYATAQALIILYYVQDPILSLAVFVLSAISTYGLLTLTKMLMGLIRT